MCSVDFPNIEHVDSISIAYGDRLPCNETLLQLWEWAEDDYNQYKCFELDEQFLDDDSDEGTTPSDEEEDEENTDTDTDTGNDTEVPDTDSSNDTNNDDTTQTSPSNDSPASDEQDTTDESPNESTEDSTDDTNSDDTFDGSGGRIVSHTGVAILLAAVVFFCC
jgi:hypothetical protein